ncbi:rcc01693 family protein [uncultured Roseobacter sp.]|uniref:rcc01693 family protein n=1 Tax=uncultured Roseobacter sp. TaxID=114847 RepID=UPI0026294A51|nr:rcc01693 family protein [uncultured Roseobacter sp.]
MSQGLDWPALLRAGVRGLGLRPEEFWQLTPAELQLLLGDPGSSGPLLSSGLEALMDAWPDEQKKDVNDDG